MTRWTTAPKGSERTAPHSTGSAGVPPTAATSQPAPGAVPAPAAPLAPERPTPAQWARTLAVGTVAGTLHLPRTPGA